jgi:hypothetical protein
MRRPWPVVARTTLAAARSGAAGREGVRQAVLRAPMALSRRRRVPTRIEVARRLLDRSA